MAYKVLGDASGDVFSNQHMTGVLTVCAKCGKEFRRYSEWIYKSAGEGGGHRAKYYCSYHCWPASGLLNEKKYDDEKLRKAALETYQKNKKIYDERNAAYQKAHRVEHNAKQLLRTNAGTPEAEAARLERNRKNRERKKQKAIEKWKEEERCLKKVTL